MFKDFATLTRALISTAGADMPQPRWRPAADVFRTRRGWLIKLELAGVRPEEIDVSIRGHNLMICGRRRDFMLEDCQQCYSLEISYTSFQRQFELPRALNDARITSQFRDGMLLVRIETEGTDS